ncbi:hypothetical protein ACH4PU_32135 [Streptomyces sp. NPDC021100]|uniref:hypothetical protein n=1 Tax=Streptomyces sp. NPDC021100 TaxID=3365114 RepID=UPI0037B17939
MITSEKHSAEEEEAGAVALLVPVRGRGRIAVRVHRTLADGLFVHRAVGQPGWRLCHYSGLALAAVPHRWQGALAAALLAGVTDWTRGPADLRADVAALIEAVDGAVRQAGGELLLTPGGEAERLLSVRSQRSVSRVA